MSFPSTLQVPPLLNHEITVDFNNSVDNHIIYCIGNTYFTRRIYDLGLGERVPLIGLFQIFSTAIWDTPMLKLWPISLIYTTVYTIV